MSTVVQAAAGAAASSIVILVLACVAAPPVGTGTPPSPGRQQQPVARSQMQVGHPDGAGGFLTDSARRVRDSINWARSDSGAAMVLRSIAGRESSPAESVFKNIQVYKGVPAARVVTLMNLGFSRGLGVSCGFCHVPGAWDLDDKQQKRTGRIMAGMVRTINREYLSKVHTDRGTPPIATCFTCHRGNEKPPSPEGGAPAPRPAGAPPANPGD